MHETHTHTDKGLPILSALVRVDHSIQPPMGSVHAEDHTCLDAPGAISVLKQLYSGFTQTIDTHTHTQRGEGYYMCTRYL